MNHSSRVSFNGGRGGITARPTAAEMAAAREHHIGPTHVQTANLESASHNRRVPAAANHGKPSLTAAAPAHTAAPRHTGPTAKTAVNRAAPAHRSHQVEADRMMRRQATHAQSRPASHHSANIRPPAPRRAHVRTEPGRVHGQTHIAETRPRHSQQRVAQQRAPRSQPHIAEARPPHSVPHVTQPRSPAARGPAEHRSIPRSQPTAHATARPLARPAPALHNAQPERKHS